MLRSFFKNILLILCFVVFNASSAYSIGYEGPREGWGYDPSVPSNCHVGSFGDFDPFGVSSREVHWVMDNPTCLGFSLGIGVTLMTQGIASGSACAINPAAAPFSTTSYSGKIPASNILNVSASMKLASMTGDCGTRLAQSSAASAVGVAASVQATAASASAAACCAVTASYVATVATATGILGALFETAEDTFENARICGYDWYGWKAFNEDGSENCASGDLCYWKRGSYPESYSYKLDQVFISAKTVEGVNDAKSIDNQHYREFLYGGVEKVYDGCLNPFSWSNPSEIDPSKTIAEFRLGYDTPHQRYYMRGPNITSHYACHRFVSSGTRPPSDEEMAAFDCCVNASQRSMCIINEAPAISGDEEVAFCSVGNTCNISKVGFLITQAKGQSNVICAQTSTLCPYDHLLGGGTEKIDHYDSPRGNVLSSQIENYCQFNKHCVIVPGVPNIRITDFKSSFISGACMDFVGHSQNVYPNARNVLPMRNSQNFSAPLAECISETLKSMIQNRAGHTLCADPDQSPIHGICGDNQDDDYQYKEGELLDTPSPFSIVQNFLRDAIKIVLALSVAFFGYNILLALKPVDKKTMLTYIMKFALVVYFALGTGWQDLFIDNVFGISSDIGTLVMKFEDEDADPSLIDGCQFPRFDGSGEIKRDANVYNGNDRLVEDDPYYKNKRYAPGFEYLKLWDTLDCKIVRAIGFGPSFNVANLVLTILAGLFTGGLGIIFVIFTFIFAFFYISMTIRALHIFLISTIAIAILIFISPITIATVMFQKTKSVFDGWLRNLLGFMVQPAILFAYIAILVAVMDYSLFGMRYYDNDESSAITFVGNGLEAPKATICSDGDVSDNSLYCIFGLSRFSSYHGLEPIGIVVPLIFDINKEKLDTIIRAGIIMFIFSKFMDKISDLAGELTGSRGMSSSGPSAASMASKSYGIARGIQKRGTRVAKSVGGKMAGKAKRTANFLANSGKSVSRAKPDGSAKSTGTQGAAADARPQGAATDANNKNGSNTTDV